MAVQEGMEVDDMKINTFWWGMQFTAINDIEWAMLKRLFAHDTIERGEMYEWYTNDPVDEHIKFDEDTKTVEVNR